MLTICPTPIGNLEDVTERQREALAEADVVACEDTRRTGKLLERLDIERTEGRPRLVAYHEHNETEASGRLERALASGEEVVLVSDAGTPLVSDPGYEIVERAVERGVEIRSLPGPSAVLVALVGSGLPCHAFQFRGFAPASREARRTFLREVDSEEMTTVLYESPHRLLRTLDDLREHLGPDRRAAVARELTKKFEEIERGSLTSVREYFASYENLKGECVIVVDGAD